MAWNFCTSQAAIAKAGANANTTIIASGARLAEFSDQVEGNINTQTRKDWITNPPTANYTGILKAAASALIANEIIQYDPTGYLAREAETKLDVNTDTAQRAISELKKIEVQDVI